MVFVVFFLVFYGALSYGLIFTAQQSLNLAAQDGARKALQWQAGTSALGARANAAMLAAQGQAAWIATVSNAPVRVAVCGPSGVLSATTGAACSGQALAADQIEVLVSYAYGAHPLIPNLPLLDRVLVPGTLLLTARATVHMGDSYAAAVGGY